MKAGTDGFTPPAVGAFAVGATFLLIPMMAFFNLWSNWGATLYGEVRGASDFRQNIYAMAGALVATSIAAVVLFLLFSKTFGLGLLQRGQQRVLGRDDPDRRVAVPGPARGLVPRQSGVAVHPHRACCRCGSSAGSARCSCPRRA